MTPEAPRTPTPKWHRGHREQLWQLIESGFQGVWDGDVICKSYRTDLLKAGYAVKGYNGMNYSTPKGEQALREGRLNDGSA